MGGIRESIGGSNGSATQEAGPVAVSLVDGTVVAASEVDGAEVGDGIDVGSAGRVAVGVWLGVCTPHPATSTTDRTDNERATLRIERPPYPRMRAYSTTKRLTRLPCWP